MKPLPTTFRYDHYDFTLLKRTGDIAMFAKTKPNMSRNLYEVVRVQKHDDYTIHGNLILAHEAMPGNEKWGKDGWSYPSQKDAWAKFNALVTASGNGVFDAL